MKITAALICAVVSVLFAFILDFWVRGKKGTGEDNARILAIIRGRSSNFRSFQYLPVSAAVVVITVAVCIGIDWKQASACIAGAAAVIIPIVAGSFSFADGVTAGYNEAVKGDIRQSLRAGFRTGAVTGAWITGISLLSFCIMDMALKTSTMVTYAFPFALGAVITSVVLHTGGEVYSSAYDLAVPSRDFTDRTGSYISSGADLAGTYITAAAAAIALSDVAVATSGVTSTFTSLAAVRFPLFVYGAGIIGSIAGIFLYRTGIGNDLSKGAGVSLIASGVITAAFSFYFSMSMMQTRVYAWTVTAGIAGAIILSGISRAFSSDSRVFLSGHKTDRNLGRNMAPVFNLGSGMVSTAIYTIIIIAAAGVSYMFASYYGVALCAVGMCSVTATAQAVSGLSAVTSTVSDILASGKETSDDEVLSAVSNSLYTVCTRNVISSKTYSTISGSAATLAAFCAFFCITGEENIDIMSLRVFCGIIAGASAAFLLAGLLISSVRITGRVALRDIGRNDDETGAASAVRGAVIPAVIAVAFPAVFGLFVGVKSLAGFIISAAVTGYVLITATNNSGIHYDNTALQSLSSLLKMIAVFSVAFLPVFMKVGGFLFR